MIYTDTPNAAGRWYDTAVQRDQGDARPRGRCALPDDDEPLPEALRRACRDGYAVAGVEEH